MYQDKEKENLSWDDSVESDDFSLGINGGNCISTQEEESSKRLDVGLMQCSENHLNETHKAILSRKENLELGQLNIGDLAGVTYASKNEDRQNENGQDILTKEQNNKDIKKLATSTMVQREERRTSARLKKDLLISTNDKIIQMGKKRNLEGTNLNSENSFSVLEENEIALLAKGMGIDIDDSNFLTIDLIKELEIARHAIAEKKLAHPA